MKPKMFEELLERGAPWRVAPAGSVIFGNSFFGYAWSNRIRSVDVSAPIIRRWRIAVN